MRAPLRPTLLRPTSQLPRAASRTLISAPKPGSGPLLTRRADRALPAVQSRRWMYTLPLFALVVGGSTLAIFNYQKQTSSVVEATLYALRTNARVRDVLGPEIYFASQVPWIWGTIDQVHGKVDIEYRVKGKRQAGKVRFVSLRKSKRGFFETVEWSLTTDDGQTLQLYDPSQPDPFRRQDGDGDD
ncbi:cytochrome oxidase complex assembly protein 1-domain-containing protein [Phyllosticta capitalensis]|uniref:Cytochrome oxidase complex assembly protein 1-domain-containing protein n=1 Tax=Phyllosticta capitalensis TaxID=121624 RepID=A0ABR1YB75_9PEZI